MEKNFLEKFFLEIFFLENIFLEKIFLEKNFFGNKFLEKSFLEKKILEKKILEIKFLEKKILEKKFWKKKFGKKKFGKKICIGPIICIGREIRCLPYAGFFSIQVGCQRSHKIYISGDRLVSERHFKLKKNEEGKKDKVVDLWMVNV